MTSTRTSDPDTEPALTDGIEWDAEALIRQARRRTRRRRLSFCTAGLIAIGIVASGVAVLRGGAAPAASTAGASRAPGRSRSPATVPLRNPTALAVSASGTLYVVDTSRDQVLRLLPSGKFAVFAGNGRTGFSGDGGPATRAGLRLSGWSTIAVGRDGTVYIADSGNGRVRAVAPDGVIRTVAGDGGGIQHLGRNPPEPRPWRRSRPALRTAIGSPQGIALGPGGRLYIEGDSLTVLNLGSGRLRWLAGRGDERTPLTRHEELEQHFSNDYGGVAVDRRGDVFVAGFPQLFERTAAGRLRFLGDGFRAGGGPAPMAVNSHGIVYAEYVGGVFRISSAAPGKYDLVHRGASIVPNRRIDQALGWRNLERGKGGAAIAPASGLAIASDGMVYFATDSGDGWAPGALVEITATGRVRVLWRAKG